MGVISDVFRKKIGKKVTYDMPKFSHMRSKYGMMDTGTMYRNQITG